jgi:hypothetical protein
VSFYPAVKKSNGSHTFNLRAHTLSMQFRIACGAVDSEVLNIYFFNAFYFSLSVIGAANSYS